MRKAVIVLSLFSVFALSIVLSSLSVSYYRRWQASKLLAIVSQFRPGITTAAEVHAAVTPFGAYESREDGSLEYDFYNSPAWMYKLAYRLRFLPFRIAPPWALFTVRMRFVDGLLAEMHLTEMQEDQPGYPHPNSASVSIYAKAPHTLPADFAGYVEYSQSAGSLDSQGHKTGFICCHTRFIQMDERATSTQLSRSLNFQLHCLTSFLRCKDDHEILP